jgi:uncharacterized protein (DUF983 family)
MGFKETKLYSILNYRCPRCHEGKLFINSRAYSMKMAEMNKRCPACGENFSREPGFYYGAAYVSYGLAIALWVSLWVALSVFDSISLMEFAVFEDTTLFLSLGIGLSIVLIPVVYRLSRAIWINLFVKYDRNASTSAR